VCARSHNAVTSTVIVQECLPAIRSLAFVPTASKDFWQIPTVAANVLNLAVRVALLALATLSQEDVHNVFLDIMPMLVVDASAR